MSSDPYLQFENAFVAFLQKRNLQNRARLKAARETLNSYPNLDLTKLLDAMEAAAQRAVKQKEPPLPDPSHPSLKPDPNAKGSYYRKIQDINRALREIDVERLPLSMQLVVYYAACEKLALAMTGIDAKIAAEDAYGIGKNPDLDGVKAAISSAAMTFSNHDLDAVFDGDNAQSARRVRNRVMHDLGPTNVQKAARSSATLIPKMRSFLACGKQVLATL